LYTSFTVWTPPTVARFPRFHFRLVAGRCAPYPIRRCSDTDIHVNPVTYMTDRRIPDVLWVALITLAIIVLAQFAMSLRLGVGTFVGAAIGALLLWGLYRGYRWAYVLVVVIVPLKLIVITAMGAGGHALLTFALDCLVLVPVIMSTPYFWPKETTSGSPEPIVCPDTRCSHQNPRDSRFCARCGCDLTAGGARFEGPV